MNDSHEPSSQRFTFRLTVTVFAVVITGLACSDRRAPVSDLQAPSDVLPDVSVNEPPAIPVAKLRGKWRGVAYQSQFGSFQSVPLQRGSRTRPGSDTSQQPSSAPNVSLDVLIEIDDKYLVIPGVESCKITFTYHPTRGRATESSGIFRILPPRAPRMREAKPNERSEAELQRLPSGLPSWQVEDRQDNIVFNGSAGQFELVSLDADNMEIKGQVRSVGDVSIMRQLFVVLDRVRAEEKSKAEASSNTMNHDETNNTNVDESAAQKTSDTIETLEANESSHP